MSPTRSTRSSAPTAVWSVSVPALVGASLGAAAALLLPRGDQGDLFASVASASSD